MKKFLSLLLALLFVCSLAACSQSESKDDMTAPVEGNTSEMMEMEIP